MHVADFLFPRDLEVNSTKIKRVLFIGSCLSEFFVKNFSAQHPEVFFDHILFNNAASLPRKPNSKLAEYDLQYVQLPLRSVLGDAVVRVFDRADTDWLEVGKRNLDAMIDAAMGYNTQSGILTFVSNFIVPQGVLSSSLLDQYGEADFASVVRGLNEHLAFRLKEYKNTFVANIDMIASSLGKRYFLNDIIYFYTQGSIFETEWSTYEMNAPWSFPDPGRIEPIPDLGTTYENKNEEFFAAVYRQMEAMYRTVHQIDSVKLVIFDLDNTMWRGQIAEHYQSGARWPGNTGWPMGLWEAIQHLRRRGIIVSIASKNDESYVKDRWDDATESSFVKFSDFTYPQINWNTKADNIKSIIDMLSLTAKSVLFVDDNPVERESVKAQLPEIRTLGSDPYVVRRILLWSPETQIAAVTDVTTKREEMLKKQVVRETSKKQLTREEFLLELAAKIHWVTLKDNSDRVFNRVFELVNKTNQFNTNGVRWTHEDYRRHFAAGGQVHAFSVEDRYTEYGVVGVAFTIDDEILQFVMSCRVLGMDIEVAAVGHMVERLRKAGAGRISARIVETPSNTPCRTVFEKAGFAQRDDGEFVLEADAEPVAAKHVTILESEDSSGVDATLLALLPPDFDAKRYFKLHEDVRRSGQTAEFHYLTHGIAEGRPYK